MENGVNCSSKKLAIPIIISTHYCSVSDEEDSPQEPLPIEKFPSNELVRRTVDLNRLFLAKSYEVENNKSSGTPFGPKANAFIVPSKNFDNPNIVLDTLENYNIWSDIGRGTYGVVKFATYKPTERKFAIKIYERNKIQEPLRKKSIKREISILKKLNHPGIVQLIEVIEGERNLYLVMEYIQGCSLQSFVHKKPWKRLDEQEAVGLFVQIIEALEYCHSKNISHRDIKLENILIENSNKIKIIDFGFATCKQKKNYIYCGTPNYMAPEIIKKIDYLGPPVDIWACGVLLYIITTGGFPFGSSKESKVFKKIIKGEIVFPDSISYNCKMLITDMLDPDPDTRITASQILEHPWVLSKANSVHHVPPHNGDNTEVVYENY
jgi:serine/threonine protein kinase